MDKRSEAERDCHFFKPHSQPQSQDVSLSSWASKSVYSTTQRWPSQSEKKVWCLPQRSTLPRGETHPQACAVSHLLQASGEQKREGLVLWGEEERIRKAAWRRWPLSSFQNWPVFLQVDASQRKGRHFCRWRHICRGRQLRSGWGLRSTMIEWGPYTRHY